MRKHYIPILLRKFGLVALLLIASAYCSLVAQEAGNIPSGKNDSLVQAVSRHIQKIGRDGVTKSNEKYLLGKNIARQREVISALKKIDEQLKVFLREGIDTAGLNNVLSATRTSVEIVKDGIITNKGSNQTQRNLTVSAAILSELSQQVRHVKSEVDGYALKLGQFQNKSDSLLSDSTLFSFEPDSAGIAAYAKRIQVIAKISGPIDSVLKRSVTSIEEIQYTVDVIAFELASLEEDIDQYSERVSAKAFSKEFPYLFEEPILSRPFKDIIQFSAIKEIMVLSYYTKDHVFLIVIIGLFILLSFYFIRSLKQQLAADNKLSPEHDGQLILRKPFLSAVFIVTTVFQFLFPQPPFVFSACIWLIGAVCVCIIFYGYISRFWLRFWFTSIGFFIVASAVNLLLQISRTERIITLLLAIAGVLYAGFILYRGYKLERKEKSIVYFIMFLFVCELISAALNISGRVNLSKTFLIAGYAGVVIAILFLWVLRLGNEGIVLAFDSYKKPERRSFFINFNKVGNEVPGLLYFLLIVGWFFLVGRNFYGFNKFYHPLTSFFSAERKIGNYSFTLMGSLIFFFILGCSVFISKLVSFFASEPAPVYLGDGSKKKISSGSWILLIRILIISIGVFLSFAATGISLDRITIVFGALGVGIGLGLQELFNNLVSGIVLSFERPVHVGDLIELDGKMGTMKSIGFRSSIITSSEGASIVIPNGELLSHRLINWSMGNHLKQNSILLSVAIDTDLDQVKTLLSDILNEDERILTHPPAKVVFKELLHGTVDLEIVFWPKHISTSQQIRSDLISRIKTVFSTEGIVIPIPQEELYIRSFPDAGKEGKEGMEEPK